MAKMKLPEECIEFLRKYLEFMLNSKILNKAARIYIESPYDTAKLVFSMYNKDNPSDTLNIKTSLANLDYNRKKINRHFDEDMLFNVIYMSAKADLSKYTNQLRVAMDKFNKTNVFSDYINLNLPKIIGDREVLGMNIDSFLLAIAPYRKSNIRVVEDVIAKEYSEVVAYLNYISSLSCRTPEQEEIYQKLMSFLTGKTDTGDCSEF